MSQNRFLVGQVYTWTSLLEPFFAFFIGYVINVILCIKVFASGQGDRTTKIFLYSIYVYIMFFSHYHFFLTI